MRLGLKSIKISDVLTKKNSLYQKIVNYTLFYRHYLCLLLQIYCIERKAIDFISTITKAWKLEDEKKNISIICFFFAISDQRIGALLLYDWVDLQLVRM